MMMQQNMSMAFPVVALSFASLLACLAFVAWDTYRYKKSQSPEAEAAEMRLSMSKDYLTPEQAAAAAKK